MRHPVLRIVAMLIGTVVPPTATRAEAARQAELAVPPGADDPARAQGPPDLPPEPPPAASPPSESRVPGASAEAAGSPSGLVDTTVAVPPGFHRDAKGRLMQTSFDLQNRIWVGVAYAPRRRLNGAVELAPTAFDFGAAFEVDTPDGLTRHRFRFLDGQVRLHPFGLDLTAFRYDLSHAYQFPLLRITTFFGEPARHDLYLNIGLYTEAGHFEVAPRGVDGEYQLTLANLQGTLDLWQSADLRSFVRLRAGPGAEVRFGPWGETARLVGFLPQAILEGNLLLGRRALQCASFKLRTDTYRSVTMEARPLPFHWLVSAEGAWEVIFIAINDQPVSLRLAVQGGWHDEGDVSAATGETPARTATGGWEWTGTVGLRMSFFSPPLSPSRRR